MVFGQIIYYNIGMNIYVCMLWYLFPMMIVLNVTNNKNYNFNVLYQNKQCACASVLRPSAVYVVRSTVYVTVSVHVSDKRESTDIVLIAQTYSLLDMAWEWQSERLEIYKKAHISHVSELFRTVSVAVCLCVRVAFHIVFRHNINARSFGVFGKHLRTHWSTFRIIVFTPIRSSHSSQFAEADPKRCAVDSTHSKIRSSSHRHRHNNIILGSDIDMFVCV